MDKVKQLLKEMTKDSLSEESLQKITEAIGEKAKNIAETEHALKLEAALVKQDADYSEKLQTLLEEIDENHTSKMEKIVEALETKHCDMLKNVVSKYKDQYLTEFTAFKEDLVNKIDKFFDIVVEEQIPSESLQLACENTHSKMLLDEISKMIGVSELQQNKLVKEGLLDAKTQIDTLTEQVAILSKENGELVEKKISVERDMLLEQMCKGLPEVKQTYAKRVLGNKSVDFITENFGYTIKLFDEEDGVITESIKEEARKGSKVISEDIDTPEQIIEEKVERDHADQYMESLKTW